MNAPHRVPAFAGMFALLFAAGACVGPLFAQVAPAAASTAANEEPVVLSPFRVSATQTGRYQSTEATSGNRVRVNVFDAPQSISVITRDLIDDVGADRILDAAKYVSGITESVIPTGLDRTTVRGFQIDGTTVDGFSAGNQQANLDPAIADRLEVVKGPNAILAPTGVPGGTVNIVTRKPQFRNFGTAYVQIGQYDANRGELDYNRVLGAEGNLAFRVLLARQDSEGYVGNHKRNTTFMPMVSMRTKGGTELTAQFEYFDFSTQNFLGVPVNPAASSTNDASILPGIARDLNTWDDDFRIDERHEGRVFLTSPLSDSINMRIAARYAEADTTFTQELPGLSTANSAANTSGGGINPLTGLYVPGSIFGGAPNFTASAAPAMSRNLPRSGQWFNSLVNVFNFQNDYVHQYKSGMVETTTLGGFAYNYFKGSSTSRVANKVAINYDAPAAATYTLAAVNARTIATTNAHQAYVAETVKVFDGRLAVNGSYSYNNFDLAVVDRLTTNVANQRTVANVDTDLKSYGLVVKPIPSIALYYGYNEVASTLGASTIAAGGPPLQTGKQREYGIRYEGFEKRLFATLAYFKIDQSNFSVPNPANLSVPPPNPLLPALLADRAAKGWEFEVRANLTTEFSLIGNITDFTNRDPNNVPFRGTAEKSWAVLGNYRFNKDSSAAGLSLSLGLEHLGRRPGDAPGGIAPGSTPTQIIPNQPTFWLPERTLANLVVSYPISPSWNIQLNVDNIFDKDYLAAAVGRTTVMVGTPRNARMRLTYKF